jgi:hypothetical protein
MLRYALRFLAPSSIATIGRLGGYEAFKGPVIMALALCGLFTSLVLIVLYYMKVQYGGRRRNQTLQPAHVFVRS